MPSAKALTACAPGQSRRELPCAGHRPPAVPGGAPTSQKPRKHESWYAFGFARPNDPETPEVPEHLVVTPGAPGSGVLFIDWDHARRAESYRVSVLSSVNSPVVAERLVEESEITLTGLASGQTVRIAVASRNAKGGESAAAPEVTITVP